MDINKANCSGKQRTLSVSVGIPKLPSLAVDLDKATGSVYSPLKYTLISAQTFTSRSTKRSKVSATRYLGRAIERRERRRAEENLTLFRR